VSEHVRDSVVAGAPDCRVAVVYNGADPGLFHPDADQQENGGPTIVSVGNLIPIKGHELLLRALAAVADKHPEVLCEIVGDGPERAHLAGLATELKISTRVRFLGRLGRHELARTLQRSTLFALPSRYEGLGCVYLEAMASGKVAIGCRGQGIEEIIQHGRNGWLVGPDSVEELAAALSSLLGSRALRESIAAQGRETVLAGFTVRHQAERLAAVYRKSIP